MKKRLLAVLLAITTILSMTACGSNKKSAEKKSNKLEDICIRLDTKYKSYRSLCSTETWIFQRCRTESQDRSAA